VDDGGRGATNDNGEPKFSVNDHIDFFIKHVLP
jgi:hypothetical protein